MNDYSRSIILILTLNEKENLRELIPQIFGSMPDISVLIVDDSSRDGTRELIETMKHDFRNLFLLERKNNFGYGRSSVDGIKLVFQTGYDFLVTMDADFSHDFNLIPVLIDKLKNYDIVVGSRYIKGGGITNWSFHRKVLSRFANFYVRSILHLPIKDATTGFNGYRTSSLKKINLDEIKSDGYAFLVEKKYRLLKAGCSFVEYPIMFSERREGQSKMSAQVIWESIWLPWKLRRLKL